VVNEGLGWPPPGEQVTGEAVLPMPATAVWRLPLWTSCLLVALPAIMTLQYGRLVRDGMPASRLLNPGVLGVVVLLMSAVAAFVLPARRRLLVAGGPGWVARRPTVGARWRVVRLADVTTYSVREVSTRGGRKRYVTLGERTGRRTALAFPATHPAGPALVAALQADGAREVAARELRTMGPLRVVALTAGVLAIALVPLGLLEVGPLSLLPASVAGEFSSGGCRAALAAEGQSAAANRPVQVRATEPVGAATWRFSGDWAQSEREYAANTADPSARAAQLHRDRAVSFHHLQYAGPTGAVLVVQAVQFATPSGAADYYHYLNRAVCERFDGRAGPAPTEVRLTTSRGYEYVRWLSGTTIYDVSPATATPRATASDVEGLAAALQAG
jgi:hypothetical protein